MSTKIATQKVHVLLVFVLVPCNEEENMKKNIDKKIDLIR